MKRRDFVKLGVISTLTPLSLLVGAEAQSAFDKNEKHIRALNETEMIGYKVVAVRNGEFFSLMTGDKYVKGRNVPIGTSHDNEIVNDYCRVLINGGNETDPYWIEHFRKIGKKDLKLPCWINQKVGRTGIYLHEKDALQRYNYILENRRITKIGKDFYLSVYKVKIEKELMIYDLYDDVILGKRITFLENIIPVWYSPIHVPMNWQIPPRKVR